MGCRWSFAQKKEVVTAQMPSVPHMGPVDIYFFGKCCTCPFPFFVYLSFSLSCNAGQGGPLSYKDDAQSSISLAINNIIDGAASSNTKEEEKKYASGIGHDIRHLYQVSMGQGTNLVMRNFPPFVNPKDSECLLEAVNNAGVINSGQRKCMCVLLIFLDVMVSSCFSCCVCNVQFGLFHRN
jgi:hypothetical protein